MILIALSSTNQIVYNYLVGLPVQQIEWSRCVRIKSRKWVSNNLSMLTSIKNYHRFREIWRESINFLVDVADCTSGLVTYIDGTDLEVFAASDRKMNPFPEGVKVAMQGHYCEETYKTRKLLHVPNALMSDRWEDCPEIKCGLISYIGLPVRMPDGAIFGTICLLDKKENFHQSTQQNGLKQIRSLIEAHLQVETLTRMDSAQHQENPELLQLYRTIARNSDKDMINIPVCSHCKKFRTESGNWVQLSPSIYQMVGPRSSHGICPDCLETFYPDLVRS